MENKFKVNDVINYGGRSSVTVINVDENCYTLRDRTGDTQSFHKELVEEYGKFVRNEKNLFQINDMVDYKGKVFNIVEVKGKFYILQYKKQNKKFVLMGDLHKNARLIKYI